jgi:MFS family permease
MIAAMALPRDLPATRRRLLWTLVATVGLGSTGNIAAVTVGTIAAAELSGTTALSGAPGAMVVLGSAAGSYLLSSLMVRRGRRAGLVAGYGLGVLGAGLAVVAMTTRSLPLLFLGTILIGFGSSSNQLSRYAAADMYPVARRGSAIATVVWGATIGAIIGPNLISSAGTFATGNGLPAVSGAYLIPSVFVGFAALLCFALLRPDPYSLADESADDVLEPHARQTGTTGGLGATGSGRLLDVLRRPVVLAALAVLVVGQISMTVVMTMTPLHITDNGGGLAAVGFVISAHTFGMYALAPVSGRLADRFGSHRVILAGLSTLAIAGLLAAAAPPDGGVVLLFALFLLGYGWNLGFVAGSNLLASGLELAERTRLQGATDTIIWASAAVASLASGLIVALVSYTGLGILPALLVMTPAWLLIRRRRAAVGTLAGDASAG